MTISTLSFTLSFPVFLKMHKGTHQWKAYFLIISTYNKNNYSSSKTLPPGIYTRQSNNSNVHEAFSSFTFKSSIWILISIWTEGRRKGKQFQTASIEGSLYQLNTWLLNLKKLHARTLRFLERLIAVRLFFHFLSPFLVCVFLKSKCGTLWQC